MEPLINARNSWLDLCRALAICLVLLSHGRGLLIPSANWAEKLKFGGFLGVELFFVLSGFLIGTIVIKTVTQSSTAFSWVPNFWARRLFRTMPNYLLFLAINFGLLYFGVRAAENPDVLHYLFFIQNLAWPHPNFFREAWSLAVEEIFYFAIPVLIAIALSLRINRTSAVLLVAFTVLIASFVARLIYVSALQPTWDAGVRTIVIFRLDALMVGLLFAWACQDSYWATKLRKIAPFFALLLVPSIFLSIQSNSTLDASDFARTWLFPLTSLGCGGLIVAGLAVRLPQKLETISGYIARWSYSAYLSNLPVISLIYYFTGYAQGPSDGFVKWLCFVLGTFAVSAIVYHYFENRFLTIRDQLFLPLRLPNSVATSALQNPLAK